MRYLFLNGSAHKGNTWKLAELAKEYLTRTDSDAEFEEISVAGLSLPFCCGCSSCFRNGGKTCPHHKIVMPVLKAMERADGLVIASTTYFLRETALLKNLFDHFLFMTHRPHFFTKKALVITTTGGVGSRQSAKEIGSLLRSIGFNQCYLFPVTSFSWNAYEPAEKTKKKLFRITERFYEDIISGRMHRQKSDMLIPYNIFRGMCIYYRPGTEYETQDGIYWLERNRKRRVYDQKIPVSLFQRVMGTFFFLIGRGVGKKLAVTYQKKK